MAAVSSFFTADANANRVARKCSFVVHVELADFRKSGKPGFEELDADTYQQAKNLAESWVKLLGAVSAGIRPVQADGSCRKGLEIVC